MRVSYLQCWYEPWAENDVVQITRDGQAPRTYYPSTQRVRTLAQVVHRVWLRGLVDVFPWLAGHAGWTMARKEQQYLEPDQVFSKEHLAAWVAENMDP